MPLLDPDDLAVRALEDSDVAIGGDVRGDDLDPADRATLDAYRRVVGAARGITPADVAVEDAPAGLWSAIAGELFTADTPRRLFTAGTSDTSDTSGTPDPADTPDTPDTSADHAASGIAGVTSLRGRPAWRTPSTVLAAAAAVILLAGVIFAVTTNDTPRTTVVAKAELGVLPPGDPAGAPGSGIGTARLERVGNELDLVLQTTEMTSPPAGDHYELWLLNRSGPVVPQSLGVIDSPNGEMRATVPATVDTSKFDVVDISLEADDGNHNHSGHSLLRGTLQ